MTKIAVSGIGPDKPGIVARLTNTLSAAGFNIEDCSMTILSGQFALILVLSHPDTYPEEEILFGLKQVESETGIKLAYSHIANTEKDSGKQGTPYIISVGGSDKTGITSTVSKVLAELNINITDLNAKRISGEEGLVYLMMIEVMVPNNVNQEHLELTMNRLKEKEGLDIHINPIDTPTI